MLWDRLQKTAPVYSGDFIRTAEDSEAAIVLIDGDTVTELGENTIIRIGAVKGTEESRIELLGGNVSLTAGSGGTVLASGNDSLVLAAGSSVSAASGEGDFAFRVNQGSTVFTGSEGTVKTFQAGESSAPAGSGLLTETGSAAETSALPDGTGVETDAPPAPPPPRLIAPAEGEVFPYDEASGQATGEESPPEISFRWAADSDDDRIIVLYIFEAADNPAMENAAIKIPVSGKRIVLPRPEKGRWYWRVTPVYAGALTAAASVTGSFLIGETVPATEKTAAEQAAAERIAAEQAASQRIAAEQAAQQAAAAEHIATERAAAERIAAEQAAKQAAAAERAVAERVAAERAAAERIAAERVAAQRAAAERATAERIAAERVAAQRAAAERIAAERAAAPPPLPPPREMRLENAYENGNGNGPVLGTTQLRTNRSITFNWDPVPNAVGYVFSLYQETGGPRRRIYTVEVETATYTFDKLSLLERGNFVWTVEALWRARDGTARQGDAAESRFVIDIPELKRHELPETGNLYGN
jgi:hypothetical protein